MRGDQVSQIGEIAIVYRVTGCKSNGVGEEGRDHRPRIYNIPPMGNNLVARGQCERDQAQDFIA